MTKDKTVEVNINAGSQGKQGKNDNRKKKPNNRKKGKGQNNNRRRPRNMKRFLTRTLASTIGHLERKNEIGTAQILHSFFDMYHGAHRGQVSGMDLTSMGGYTKTLNITIAPLTYFSFLLAPSAQGGTNAANWLVYSNGGGVYQSPYLATNGATSFTATQPYNDATLMNTPGTEMRSAGCHVTIQPVVAPINKAGSVLLAYIPTLYSGAINAASLAVGVSGNNGITEDNINQMTIRRRFDGTKNIVINHMPGEDEVELHSSVDAGEDISGVGGYFFNGGSVNVQIVFEIRQYYEYVPKPSILPLTQVKSPRIPTTVWSDVNHFALTRWPTYMINEIEPYQKALQLLNHAIVADYVMDDRASGAGIRPAAIQLEVNGREADPLRVVPGGYRDFFGELANANLGALNMRI